MVREAITTKLGPDELDYVAGLIGEYAPTRSAVIERIVREHREGQPNGPIAIAEFSRFLAAVRDSNGPVTIGYPRLDISHWIRDERKRLGVPAPGPNTYVR